MKKSTEQIKEIMRENIPEELKNIKIQIKSVIKIIKIFMFIMIGCTVIFFADSIINAVNYAGEPNHEAANKLGESILSLISSAAWLIVTAICKNTFSEIDKSSTPFIPQVPKGIRKIAAAIIIMFLISAAEQLLYPIFTGTEPKLIIDGTNLIFVSILILLSLYIRLRLQASAGIGRNALGGSFNMILRRNLMSIILRLDRVMADRKMSLNELAEKVGISNVNLSNLKTGKVKAIRFSTLEAICDVLDCQPGDILEYSRDNSDKKDLP